MVSPQVGIFAIGTSSHCYLEFDRLPGVDARTLVRAVNGLDEPHTTVGGVNLIVGLRPTIWREVAGAETPADAADFDEAIVGPDGFRMPATQHDAWLWIAGSAPDLVFDVASELVRALDPVAQMVLEVTGWSYRHSRDLTGFEDGTENPSIAEAPGVAIVGAGGPGEPGAGSSIVLVQKWRHDTKLWEALSVEQQEQAMGRTKADSIELDDAVKPADSHVARNVITDETGAELAIFRRNVPYGTLRDHGTMFVGFSCEQARLARMLRRMAGREDGIRDALTRYTTPLTGAYYVVPAVDVLAGI